MPQFAANLSMMFQEVPFLERFEAAAAAGFKGVEFLFPYDHPAAAVRDRLRSAGLTQALFNLPPGDWAGGERGLAALPGREADFAAALERALEYAAALECPQIHAMAGMVPAGADRSAYERTYVANLRLAAERAGRAGVRVLIEPLNARDMPGYFLRTVEQARDVIAAVGSDNVFLQFDIYHCQITEGDLAERIRALWSIISHFQIAGVPGRHEPDVGEINHPFLFDLIDGLGYHGWIGCEYRPKAGTVEGLGWAQRYGVRPRAA
jgi:2-dehydrotetronate isomerase